MSTMVILQHLILYLTNDIPASDFYGMPADIATIWVELFSTIFFAATVAVLAWETILQRKEIEVDEYSELRQHHHDLITLQIDPDNEKTLEIFDKVKIPDEYRQINDDDNIILKPDEKRIFQLYLAEFDLYERVWLLKDEKEKITESEWLCWVMYLERVSHHWLFRYTFNQTRTIFTDGFMDEIKERIIDRQDRGEDAREKIIEDTKVAYEKEDEVVVFSKKAQYPK